MDLARTIRSVANVVNLSTPFGLLVARLGGGRLRRRGHLVFAEDVRLPAINASAMTIGDVVLVMGKTLDEAVAVHPDLVEHEEQHAWQYAYCLGLPFIPLYVAAMGWSMVRAGDRASANHFEVQAGLAKGGYRINPKVPLRQGIRRLLRRHV